MTAAQKAKGSGDCHPAEPGAPETPWKENGMHSMTHTTAGASAPLEANDNRTAKRRRIEQMIEMAIALLDAVDGDENIEETADLEPYLGWVGSGADRNCANDDREADDADHGEPENDDEPSLGWTDNEAERGTGYSVLASRLPFLDGEICQGDEPECEDEHGASQELYAGIGCLAGDTIEEPA